ncbi:hypothetical protein SAMN02745216_04536 [Desulfatibacillum alkenivorans DSM 16219]|jgi:hypothetical protein|uniref:Cytoplasmic protein n=1 Tax=Desulfatibacillum alkenivorans DSM 16219 TaxID=1121393 RepID=A0A1M6XIA7_9BACT|nr:DUF5320 domain-containing protein [Desulfatibacillum alkenivorans]SHL05638.1 hypothetical protein SAMN02745216_04536 [Desulfatibacillum alkenivorans DSM 16219]
MPGGDGTGPLGNGPLTGRGAGFCGRGVRSAGRGLGMGRGLGYGMGAGRGFGNRGFAQAGPVNADYVESGNQEELESLRSEVQALREAVNQLTKKETE